MSLNLEGGPRRIVIVISVGAFSIIPIWLGLAWATNAPPGSFLASEWATSFLFFMVLLVFVPWIVFYLVGWIVRGFTGS